MSSWASPDEEFAGFQAVVGAELRRSLYLHRMSSKSGCTHDVTFRIWISGDVIMSVLLVMVDCL